MNVIPPDQNRPPEIFQQPPPKAPDTLRDKIIQIFNRILKKLGILRSDASLSARVSRDIDSPITRDLVENALPITKGETIEPPQTDISRGLNKLREQLHGTVEYIKTTFKGGHDEVRHYTEFRVEGQTIVGPKKIGVEPGWTGRKTWTKKDENKLLDPKHKFHKRALQYLKNQLLEKITKKFDQEQISEDDFLKYCQRVDNINSNFILEIVNHQPEIYGQIIKHLKSEERRFQKKHYWKLDYAEPKRGKKVRIDKTQAKGLLHWLGTGETRREKNFGALMEVMANDIFEALGLGGQKLNLRLAQYSDGSPKFLLDGTHVEGPNGEAFTTFKDILRGPQQQGLIEGNMVRNPDDPDGPKVPLDEKLLGAALLKSLLMGDRDKVGKHGDNIGYVVVDGVAKLMNIDPGKSMEEPSWWNSDRLMQNDLRSDCTFDHISTVADRLVTKGYKNYSIFADVPLSYKIQGMREILKNFDRVRLIFNDYRTFVEQNEKILDPPELRGKEPPLVERIKNAKARLVARKEQFEAVLGERLKLSDEEIDLLDHIEKLTSPTTDHAIVKDENGKKQIQRKHLAVVNPKKNRKEWHMERGEDGKYTLSYTAKNQKDREAVLATVTTFLFPHLDPGIINAEKKGDQVVITFHEGQLEKAVKTFSEDNVAEFKGHVLFENF